jgi:hypothetical protein
VVKLLTHIPKFKGLNATAATGTRGRIIVKMLLWLMSAVVEQVVKLSTHIPRFKGLNADAATGTSGIIMVKCLMVCCQL